MRSHSFNRASILSLLLATAAALSVGCAGASSEPTEEEEGALERTRGDALSLHLAIAESKEVFSSHVESFSVSESGANARSLPCRDRGFYLTSKDSLYKNGWSVSDAARFSEDQQGSQFRDYVLASCRDASTEVVAWFGKEFDVELSVSERLLDDDYKPTREPLILRRASLDGGAAKYYSCDASFEKKLVRETDRAKFFDISVACKSRSAPTKAQLGPVEFVANPGPYAAVASYKPYALPSVPSNEETFARVKTALLGKVHEGKYSGAMSTLAKTCTMQVKKTADGLSLDHTIDSSNRTRHLDLTAADLIGFVEGDLYADPIRVTGEPVGKFAAAEFSDKKGGSFVIRFEDNSTLDAKIVRINGPEAYCRRLVAQ